MHRLRDFLYRQFRQPMDDLTRLQRVLRYGYDLARFCAEQLKQDRATQMAAALTYRTIFSLVPTIILALIVFRAFVSFDEAQAFMDQKVYQAFGWDTMKITGDGGGDGAERTVAGLINGFVEQGYELKVARIGGAGLLLLVWAALALVVTVENCFNRVFQCPRGRPWRMRVMLYWAVLTLGPVLLAASMVLTGWLYAQAASLPIIGVLFQMLGSFAALGASWLLLLLVYTLMPNTRVRLRPAIVGAFVAAVLWEVLKIAFKLYVTDAMSNSKLYGSLGLLPVFLLWVYTTWLIVLFGLELTYVMQTLQGRRIAQQRRLDRDGGDLIADARCVLPIMTSIGEAFGRGATIGEADLADRLRLPGAMVANLCRRLEEAGLIHKLDDGGYALARPADRIAIPDLLKLARSLSHLDDHAGSTPGWSLLAELNAAETEAGRGRTLADALRPH